MLWILQIPGCFVQVTTHDAPQLSYQLLRFLTLCQQLCSSLSENAFATICVHDIVWVVLQVYW